MAKKHNDGLSFRKGIPPDLQGKPQDHQRAGEKAQAQECSRIRVSHQDARPQQRRRSSTTCTPTSSPTSGVVKSVDGVSFDVPSRQDRSASSASPAAARASPSLSLMQLVQRPRARLWRAKSASNLGRQGLRRRQGPDTGHAEAPRQPDLHDLPGADDRA